MKMRYIISLLILMVVLAGAITAKDYKKVTFKQIKAEGKIWGIDLSHHQAAIDWKKLKTQKPHFIFLKTSEGATHTDRLYKTNYKNARKLGIIVGSYHFFSYRSDGKSQAKHFLRSAKYQDGDLPLVLDAEYANNMPAKKNVSKELISFLKTVKAETGRKPIIYCDYDYYEDYLEGELKTDYLLWICDYRRKPACDWTFWQTTDKFKIAGVKGLVDFNIFNGSKSELKKILF
jgi:lysozyme